MNKPFSWLLSRARLPTRRNVIARRPYATEPPTQLHQSRIARIEARLPFFLRRFTTPLRNAPVSHITAFLLLHEITAIVPLFGLAAFFHYSSWLPPYISEGQWVAQGTEKFGKYLRKKGWISDEEASGSGKWYGTGAGGVRIVAELATAWAVTKALLPARLALSIWATPWFARWTVLPVAGLVGRVLGRRAAATVPASAPAAAGTGAVAGGALPKTGKTR